MEGRVVKQPRRIDIETLRAMLSYCPESGRITWLINRPRGVKAGDEFGGMNAIGYRVGCVNGVQVGAHRVAWALLHGVWPDSWLDHKNLNRSDNRAENLRKCSVSQNIANIATTCRNKSGVKGVCWNKRSGKWQAGIKVQGKSYHLGLHETLAQATAARMKAANDRFGEFARHA